MTDKTADLAGPGIGDYGQLAHALPENYQALLPLARVAAGAAENGSVGIAACG